MVGTRRRIPRRQTPGLGGALTAAHRVQEEDIRRESLLEVAEQQAAVGLEDEARKTWNLVAAEGEDFKRAIQEREFFQMVESKKWDEASAALKAMSDSPDVVILQTGLAAELAKHGELQQAMKLVATLGESPSRLEIVRLAYEKFGSQASVEQLRQLLANEKNPEIIISAVIGHVGGFRREKEVNQ